MLAGNEVRMISIRSSGYPLKASAINPEKKRGGVAFSSPLLPLIQALWLF
jgi:hypothetical protein